jgi:Cu/Ag efflux protein CusF
MNKNPYVRCVALFLAAFCLLSSGGYGQGTSRKTKKEFVFNGMVESVDPDAKWVTVSSQSIPGWLDAIKMTYNVDSPDVLKSIKHGDRVTAKVYQGDFSMLYQLKVAPPEDTPVFRPGTAQRK